MCKVMPQHFGDKLRFLRTNARLTQAALAAQLGLVTQSHLSLLEHQQSEPSLVLLLRVAQQFGVTLAYLLDDALPVNAPLPASWPSLSVDMVIARFGDQLRRQRTERSWSQADLAEQLAPLSQGYVSLLESGQKQPSLEIVLRCTALFGISADALFTDGTEPVA